MFARYGCSPFHARQAVVIAIGAALCSGTTASITHGQAHAPAPCADSSSHGGSDALDSLVRAAMREHTVPGVAVGVVRDGETVLLRAYGCASRESGAPADPRATVFRVASVSKLFVATAVAQLAEKGVVDLDADVNRYLRDLRVPDAWGAPITLRNLLTHTAGFDESIVGYAARTAADVRPLDEFLAEKLPRRGWPPGTVTSYSNYGYALAGYVVESVTGVRFAEYVASDILARLAMTRSTYEQPPPDSLARMVATGYRCAGGECMAVQPDFRSAYPPGGLVSTADDMTRFMIAHLEGSYGGARLLGDSALRAMHSRQFTHDPALPGMALGFAEDELHGLRALSHAGGSPGFASVLMLVPERRFGVFLVANGGSSRFGRAALTIFADEFLGGMPHHGLATEADAASASDGEFDPTGSYRLTRYAHRGVENLPALFLGQLHIQRGEGDTLRVLGLGDADGHYVPTAPTRWRRVGGSELIAVRTDGSRVTHAFGPLSFFGARSPAAYERLAWYDTPGFVNEALSFLLMIPLLILVVAWPLVVGVRWALRRRRSNPPVTATARLAGPRLAMGATISFALLVPLFGFGFVARTIRAAERGGGDLVYGLSAQMTALAWLPLVLTLLAVVLVALTVVAWRRRWWDALRRTLFSVIALNSLLFAALLGRWGYLPTATWWS